MSKALHAAEAAAAVATKLSRLKEPANAVPCLQPGVLKWHTGSMGICPEAPCAVTATGAVAAAAASAGAWRSKKHAAPAMRPWPKPGVSVPSLVTLSPAAAPSAARLPGPVAVRPCTRGLLVVADMLRGLPGGGVAAAAAVADTADLGGVLGSTVTLSPGSCSSTGTA